VKTKLSDIDKHHSKPNIELLISEESVTKTAEVICSTSQNSCLKL